jgi:hypothetical protein
MYKQFYNDDTPLDLDERDAVTCVWTGKAYKRFYSDKFVPEVEVTPAFLIVLAALLPL